MDTALKIAGALGGLIALLSLLAWLALREMEVIDREGEDEPTENEVGRPL